MVGTVASTTPVSSTQIDLALPTTGMVTGRRMLAGASARDDLGNTRRVAPTTIAEGAPAG